MLFDQLRRQKSASITSSHQLYEQLIGPRDPTGGIVTPATAMHNPTVFTCVRIISTCLAMLPLNLYRETRGRRARVPTTDQMARLLARRPNAWQTPFEFWQMIVAHTLLRGNGIALKVRDSQGVVNELIPLHPDCVSWDQEPDYSIKYAITQRGRSSITVDGRDTLHMRGLTSDGISGLSVVAAHAKSMGLSNLAQDHGWRSLKNGVKFPGFLKLPGKFKDNEQRTQFRDDFENQAANENIGRTPVLEGGMDFVSVGMSNTDAQYIETRKFEKAEIASIFGVPLFMLNDTEKSTTWGTGLAELSGAFVRFTLQPWGTVAEQAVQRDLLDDDKLDAKFNLAELMRAQPLERQQAYEIQARNGVLSPNEWRENENMNRRDDEAGDEYQTPGAAPEVSDDDDENEPDQV